MTIADHCLDLLRDRGPMTAQDLGAACRFAGLTTARQPEVAVRGALGWWQDGRAVRIDDEFHLVSSVLDGRWLTMRAPADARQFDAGFDLACLEGIGRRDGIPLASGGTLGRPRYGVSWTGPPGWAPSSELVGLRLVDGVAEVAAVELGDAAAKRGDQLTELLLQTRTGRSHGFGGPTHAMVGELLTLLHRDPELLREPGPPLSEVAPRPAPPPWQLPIPSGPPPGLGTAEAFVPLELLMSIADAAAVAGVAPAVWLGDEIARLADWPSSPIRPPTWPDEPPPPPSLRGRRPSLYAC
jgi:hypothetical protein